MSALVSAIPNSNESSALPPAVWRADQMGSYQAAVISTGHPLLDQELPNGGWPSATLIELLMQQPGIGEMRLLRPAFQAIARKRRIALVQPPYMPQIAAWTAWGLPVDSLVWIKTTRSADALWSAEQVLRNGSCGALLLWQSHVRTESLRRLHLAAQGTETLFWMMRPLACTQDASPASLRLALRPTYGGIQVDIVKRRGPRRDDPLHVPMDDMPSSVFLPASRSAAPISNPVPTREAVAHISDQSINTAMTGPQACSVN
ncbi:translesion DNA synthesis-associated protein ImuA [Noviherbaspirillum saxi]|uniref:Translesion DNA synthesis-associated protein ImuA n=1 Tax=Noviherbaspirillum saxi TaxID=2320863 RepID=A0A3A3GC13_9BURK|nr:translesion DNA synthesis-associated protein ImuA [Noviherbaspirillum saxi]RJF98429.1 translesion DNA synthesis-associated protein ImuA [Noviherbaspirillum saxi]